MTADDTPSVGISREQFLAEVAQPPSAPMERRPDDGWIRADPWPISARTQRALRGLIEVLIPPPPAPHPPDIIDRIEHHVRFTLPYMPPMNARGFLLLVWLLELSPLWRFRGLHTLSGGDPAKASDILTGLTHSSFMPLRQLMLAVKGLILPAYFDQSEVHVALGYDPQPFMAKRIALRKRLKSGEDALADDMMGPHTEELAL